MYVSTIVRFGDHTDWVCFSTLAYAGKSWSLLTAFWCRAPYCSLITHTQTQIPFRWLLIDMQVISTWYTLRDKLNMCVNTYLHRSVVCRSVESKKQKKCVWTHLIENQSVRDPTELHLWRPWHDSLNMSLLLWCRHKTRVEEERQNPNLQDECTYG